MFDTGIREFGQASATRSHISSNPTHDISSKSILRAPYPNIWVHLFRQIRKVIGPEILIRAECREHTGRGDAQGVRHRMPRVQTVGRGMPCVPHDVSAEQRVTVCGVGVVLPNRSTTKATNENNPGRHTSTYLQLYSGTNMSEDGPLGNRVEQMHPEHLHSYYGGSTAEVHMRRYMKHRQRGVLSPVAPHEGPDRHRLPLTPLPPYPPSFQRCTLEGFGPIVHLQTPDRT